MTTSLEDFINLGESPFQNRIIKTKQLPALLTKFNGKIILYGAGASCSDIIKELFENDILPCCITDSDPAKANTSILHIPVLSPDEALLRAGTNAVCIVAIWSVSTFYKPFVDRLLSIGYKHIYFLDSDSRPRLLPESWVEDVQVNKSLLLEMHEKLSDELSKQRFEDFIYSFLSSKLDYSNVLGSYRSLDGQIVGNDLIKVGTNDIIVHCRCGFNDDQDTYLNTLSGAKEIYLFEPTWVGRIKTKEYFHERKSDHTLIFPYILGCDDTVVNFDEKIFFTRFIDQEEYKPSQAESIYLDFMENDLQPTIIILDMTMGHIQALQGAAKIIATHKPIIILKGFRFASEAAIIMKSFPQYSYSMRYFGGITMRDGYALIIDTI